MSKPRIALAILVSILFIPTIGFPVGAEAETIDRFMGDIQEATLDFTAALNNSSLSIEIPSGATVTSASVTLEGVGGTSTGGSTLDFLNGQLNTDVWAYWEEGRGIYPPKVDPRNHKWTVIGNREVPSIQKDDDNHWYTATTDNGQPPFAWPIQLYRFDPLSAGADNITVMWNGMSTCSVNKTNQFHAEVWLYNHTDKEWFKAAEYSSQMKGDVWQNYTFDLPSPFLATDGSVDVAIVGIHSEWMGPMLPAFDVGHLYTDYIGVEVSGSTGIQYPQDVLFSVEGVPVTFVTDNITDPVIIDGSSGLVTAIQEAIDDHPVTPFNITLAFEFLVGRPTAGRLLVKDLLIEYTPLTNEAPSYVGLDSFQMDEDADWTEIIDLDSSFDDDYNQGDLTFELAEIETVPGDPLPISFRLSVATSGNQTLEAKPESDFFGDFPVPYYVDATDAFGLRTRGWMNLTVLQVGDSPSIKDPGTIQAHERSLFSYTLNVTDPDLPDDVFTFSDDSDIIDINSTTGEILWTPGPDQIGSHSFHVSVEDRFGFTDRVLMTINVENSNDPPIITSSLEMTAREGQEASYIIRAEDPDVPFGDILQYGVFADAIEVDLDPTTGRMTFIPTNDHVPSFEITIRVQDLLGETDEVSLTVLVENVNNPPRFDPYGTLTYDQNTDVTLQLMVTDPDLLVELPEPETLIFSGVGHESLMPDANGLISFTAVQSMVGEHTATYTVKDRAGVSDVLTIDWVIVDVNDDPVITTEVISPKEINEDEEFTLVLTGSDVDGDDLSWSDDSDLFDIDSVSGTITITPVQADVGSHPVTIIADDGRGGSAEISFDLVVLNINDEPVITSMLPANGESFKEGESISFTAMADDEDGDTLTYTWKKGTKVLGSGASLPVDDLPSGKNTVTLEVSDGNGGVATSQLTVDIKATVTGSLALPIALLAAVIVIGIVVLLLRRRSRPGLDDDLPPEEPIDDAGGPEAQEEQVLGYAPAGVVDHPTPTLEPPSEVVDDDPSQATTIHQAPEAPTYELEKAEVYRPKDVPEDVPDEAPEE
jgi:hypothetical protein